MVERGDDDKSPRQHLQLQLKRFHYIIVRSDLPRGLQSAQIIHAAGESAKLTSELPTGTHAVALQSDNEDTLTELSKAIDASGIPYTKITENDAPYTGQLMALGIAPIPRSKELKKLLGKVKLLR